TACGQAAKNSTENNTRQTGLFIDSPVAGLFYRTPSHQGLSNSAGEFFYEPDESIAFFLDDYYLASVPAQPIISVLDLFNSQDVIDKRVTRLAQLLQSLDEDQQLDNGIAIPVALQQQNDLSLNKEKPLLLDADETQWAQQRQNLLEKANLTQLISIEAARIHLLSQLPETLANSKSIGGVIYNLNGMIELSNYGQDRVQLLSSGDYQMPTRLPSTLKYQLSIEQQPENQYCFIDHPSGEIADSDVDTLDIYCHQKTNLMAGQLVGIGVGDSVELSHPDGSVITITMNSESEQTEYYRELSVPRYVGRYQLSAIPPYKLCSLETNLAGNLNIICENKKYDVGGSIHYIESDFTLQFTRNNPEIILTKEFSLNDLDSNSQFRIDDLFEQGDEFQILKVVPALTYKQCQFSSNGVMGVIDDAAAMSLRIECINVWPVEIQIKGVAVTRAYEELIIGVSDDAQNQYENINVAFNTSDGTPLNLKQAASNDNQLIIEGTNLIFSLNQPTGRRCSFVADGEISVLPETLVSEQNVNNFTGQVQYVLCARDSASMSGKINTLPGGLTTFPSVQYKDALLPDIESNWITASVDNNGNYTISGVIETGVDLKVSEFSNFRCDFDRGNPYASNSDNKIGTTINPTVSVAEINCLAATPLVLELEILGGKANISGADQFAIDIFQYSENSWKKIGDFIVADKQNTDLISVVLPRVYRNGSRINYSVSINSFPLVFQSCDPFDSIRVDRSTTFALTCDLNGGD
ncbi:MAG: hypothetical protein OEY38_23895, partial [Gammaproteobacteria bacterium]|nr:hypothetical protein [Gammaproteobacteria bacterium]